MDIKLFHFLIELFFGFGFPREFAGEHFVEYDSQGPYIALVTILIICEDLKWHIIRRANVDLFEFLVIFLIHGESEICYLDLLAFQQDVTGLEISMHYLSAPYGFVAGDHVFDYVDGF